jgi:DNA polymerase III subunit epsilon
MDKELYTIIDFETTGLDSEKEQITELAALKIDADGNEYGSYHTFIQLMNGLKPSPYAKVTEFDCSTGILQWQAMQALEDFIDSTTVVAQYAPFDLSFVTFKPAKFICTRALTFLVEPDENPSLGPTVERLGIEMLDAHRAIDDVRMTKEVFLHQKNIADKQGIEYRNTVVDFKNRPLRFTPAHAKIIKE